MKCVALVLVLCMTETLTQQQISQEFVLSNYKFAASVYNELITKNTTDNLLVSPLSAQIILALAQSGAENETGEEIRTSLYFPNDQVQVEDSVKLFLSDLVNNSHYSFQTANKIYIKKDYDIKNEFRKVAADIYAADLENIDFCQKAESAEIINQWVEDHTDNKIHGLVNEDVLNNKTRAVLINSLLFKSNWTNPFPKELTMKKNFYLSDNQTVEVDMMHDYDGYYYYFESSELDAKFLKLPFEGPDVSMTVVVPNEQDGLGLLEEQIEQVLNTSIYAWELVNVVLPKFRIESKIDFKEILQNLGVEKAFLDGEADFSKIAGKPGDLFISDVVQKDFLNVNEDGIEAAAATYIVKIFNRNGGPPKDFVADHPFLFYVQIKDLVVFIGRVLTPIY